MSDRRISFVDKAIKEKSLHKNFPAKYLGAKPGTELSSNYQFKKIYFSLTQYQNPSKSMK